MLFKDSYLLSMLVSLSMVLRSLTDFLLFLKAELLGLLQIYFMNQQILKTSLSSCFMFLSWAIREMRVRA
jgi:hypothetical protein